MVSFRTQQDLNRYPLYGCGDAYSIISLNLECMNQRIISCCFNNRDPVQTVGLVIFLAPWKGCSHPRHSTAPASILEASSAKTVVWLGQGSPVLFGEKCLPVGFHSNPNPAHLILIISWLMWCIRWFTTGVVNRKLQDGSSPETGLEETSGGDLWIG